MAALENEDIDTLTRIPGLGKKTAQKIVLQLKGKLRLSDDEGSSSSSSPHSEIIESLTAMGFDRKLVKKAVNDLMMDAAVLAQPKAQREGEIMRRAIILLST